MILIPLIFSLILLAIGFGVGFWLIITAIKQDKRWLVILGSVFGWILISVTVLTTLTGFILGITFWRTGNMMHGCPMCQHMGMIQPYYAHDACCGGRGGHGNWNNNHDNWQGGRGHWQDNQGNWHDYYGNWKDKQGNWHDRYGNWRDSKGNWHYGNKNRSNDSHQNWNNWGW